MKLRASTAVEWMASVQPPPRRRRKRGALGQQILEDAERLIATSNARVAPLMDKESD